jgi:transposase InsO family protein
MDLWGQHDPELLNSSRYAFIKINDFIRKSWISFLKYKDDALDDFKTWIAAIEAEYESRIDYLRTDREKEFISNILTREYSKHGITIEYSAPHTPEHNGVSKRT